MRSRPTKNTHKLSSVDSKSSSLNSPRDISDSFHKLHNSKRCECCQNAPKYRNYLHELRAEKAQKEEK